MRRALSRWFAARTSHTPEASPRGEPGELGFHGDRYLLEVVEHLAARATAFVETGANVGTTLGWFARTHPDVTCRSCEPNAAACRRALEHVGGLPNVCLLHGTSEALLRVLAREPEFPRADVLFWLDAHGGEHGWPLRAELAHLTRHFESAMVLVDDFRVPGRPDFGFDEYEGVACSLEAVRDVLAPTRTYRLTYPTYRAHTSPHHPLRGWGLFTWGAADVELSPGFPTELAAFTRSELLEPSAG